MTDAGRRAGLNLHTHLEGSVRPETAAALAAAAGVPEPPAGWEAALRMREPGTLTTFLAHVAAAYPLFSSPEAIARIVTEAVEDAAADGVAYLELRFGPATHVTPQMSLADVIGAACHGLTDGVRRSGMPAGLVACALRHHAPETNEAVARVAAAWAGRGVVGFDVAGDELVFPSLTPMERPFRIAAAAGLGLTGHAAETGSADHVREAVERLGVRRIGHGVRATDDPAALRWAADQGICFELCPTSNVLTGAVSSLADHPIRAFLDAGCAVVIGDDDPTTTGSPLSSELDRLVDTVGLDSHAMAAILATSIERAFCDEGTRAALRAALVTASSGVVPG